MVSQLAVEDILTLKEMDGIELSPSEVVRLNALGLKVEKDYRPTNDIYTLPRVAVVNGITFFEPTIGHEIWIDEAARILDYDDLSTQNAILAFALSVKDPDNLPDPSDPNEVVDALKRFRAKVSKLTPRQLVQALTYVKDGDCPEDGEDPYFKPMNDADRDYSQMSIGLGVLLDGAVKGIGLTLDDAKHMTRSQIQMMIQDRLDYDDKIDHKARRNRRMAEYYKTLEHIKQQHMTEKEGKDN